MRMDYDQLVTPAFLKKGDILVYDGLDRFQFNRYLGAGNTTLVLEVQQIFPEGKTDTIKALRIPKSRGKLKLPGRPVGPPIVEFLDYTAEGYADLKKAGIEVPKIYASKKNKYILTEMISFEMDAKTYLKNRQSMDPKFVKTADDALVRFAKSTARFLEIGDFRTNQLVYDAVKAKWILLDWTTGHTRIWGPLASGHIFEEEAHFWALSSNGSKNELYLAMENAIEEERFRIPGTQCVVPEVLRRLFR